MATNPMASGSQGKNSHEDFELTIETLDAWEQELDQFSSQILRRINELTGQPTDNITAEASDALRALQGLRGRTQ
ncbi:hypothetical protein LOC67_06230 [Stieleria sp. JC731]|uniref:hypothetical protein n=1 Tax=Pirellulaceae TaxID=2691357 RepID=UPI001E33B2FA|nr:hypothetical protein [Stieleria sp. JC731]MCC9600150.1 hypothetical protein [Stieleria sp. JC731]